MVVSVLVGASLLSAADDTMEVWAADADLRAGMPVTADDVRSVRVHFDDEASAERYVSAAQPIPVGAIANQAVKAGELVPASSVETTAAEPDRLPLAVSHAGLPAGLAVGERVDVWASPQADRAGGGSAQAHRVLDEVTVTSLGASDTGGLESSREVLVALPEATDVGDVLDGLRGCDVVLVLVGE